MISARRHPSDPLRGVHGHVAGSAPDRPQVQSPIVDHAKAHQPSASNLQRQSQPSHRRKSTHLLRGPTRGSNVNNQGLVSRYSTNDMRYLLRWLRHHVFIHISYFNLSVFIFLFQLTPLYLSFIPIHSSNYCTVSRHYTLP